MCYFYHLIKPTKILDFYIDFNIHVAVAAACLVLVTQAHFEIEIIEFSPYFIFFSTLLGYQFIRIFNNCKCNIKTIRSNLKKQTPTVLIVSLFSILGSLYFGIKIGISYLWILIPSSIITIWYTIPLFKIKGNHTSLRNYPSIKIFSIALVWSINTVLFPLQDYSSEPQIWLEFLQRFFLIIVLLIPFDIRDIYNDATLLQTLPQKVGVLNAKKIGFLYLILFFVFSFFKQPLSAHLLISELLIVIISLLFLVKATTNQSKYYASFWVESIPIFWWVVLSFFSYYL